MKLCLLILILFCAWQAVKIEQISKELAFYNHAKGLLSDPSIRAKMCVEGSKGK